MTDEELLGLTPPASTGGSRPDTGQGQRKGSKGSKTGLGLFSRPESSSSPVRSRPPSATQIKEEASKPKLAQSASAPVVGTLRPASAAEVKAQRKESFHFKRQRRWLEVHNKQHCLSFTEQEITDFRRFFDALAKGKETMPLDRFEDMLVCLDLAKSRLDIRGFLDGMQHHLPPGVKVQEITFEDFLKAMASQIDKAPMDVLKQLLQGNYDSRDLDYTTFVSERRRELIFSATGARGKESQGPSAQIVSKFSDLLEDRCYHDFGNGGNNKGGEDGVMLMGGLGTMWQVACLQHGLARTLTAEERIANYKKSVPKSPREIVGNIVKAAGSKTVGVHRMGTTVVIEADRMSM